jgi:hypothetical protein
MAVCGLEMVVVISGQQDGLFIVSGTSQRVFSIVRMIDNERRLSRAPLYPSHKSVAGIGWIAHQIFKVSEP